MDRLVEKKQMIKKLDFIEIEYTGATKDDDIIFDTTDEKTAKENDLFNPEMKYGPMVICVGEGQVIKGLDDQLEGKEVGKDYEIDVRAVDAFGKKDAKNFQLVNTSKFRKQNISPMPGMQVTVDDMVGTVKTVSGGRTLIDFNHPLASKDINYRVRIISLVEDDTRKAKSYLSLMFGEKNIDVELKEGNLTVRSPVEFPSDVKSALDGKIKKAIPAVKKVVFEKSVTSQA